jgi:Secretion system C-terminal sorting domain
MKSFFLGLLLLAGFSVSAQSLAITNVQYSFVQSTNVGEQYIKGSCDVRNLTANALDVNCTVSALTLAAGHDFRYCWGLCLNWGALTGSDPVTIPASASGMFYAEADTNGLPGITTLRMRFFRTDAVNDTASQLFTFDASTLGSAEIGPDRLFGAYPNPAADDITLDLPAEFIHQTITVQVVTTTGQLASTQTLNNGVLNVAELTAGAYTVLVRADGALAGYTRIQVQH